MLPVTVTRTEPISIHPIQSRDKSQFKFICFSSVYFIIVNTTWNLVLQVTQNDPLDEPLIGILGLLQYFGLLLARPKTFWVTIKVTCLHGRLIELHKLTD